MADQKPDEFDRYSRQVRFDPFGKAGQARLASSSAAIVGCGALGSMIAERLARAGVGRLRLIDRDWVEESNLQRQALYTESDASRSSPKCVAASEHIAAINSNVQTETLVEDITFENITEAVGDVDLIVDGTDNFQTRFLINDLAIQTKTPWVHGGCLGASGQVLTILPGETACFRCLLPEPPPPEAIETCDTAGVLGPAVGLVACWQAAEAIKILSGNSDAACKGLIILDSWATQSRVVSLSRQTNCPACVQHELTHLSGQHHSETTVLCGKNAVQIQSPDFANADHSAIEKRLSSVGEVVRNPYFLRLKVEDFVITLFAGGRTVVEGTTEVSIAKSLISRTLGA
ncbi:MAG: ThiF family adenylyltransferase [Aureliella sp.]